MNKPNNAPSDASMEITLEESGSKGRYVARVDGVDAVAELTFSKLGASKIIVDHTGVPDDLRGRGVGRALALRVVEDARKNGVRIVPLCPFFKSQAARHPDWRDVVE